MARMGTGFFDAKGHYFKTPDEATISDLSAILGKIGDGESLAPGIAHTLLHRRSEIAAFHRPRPHAGRVRAGGRCLGYAVGNAAQLIRSLPGASARW